jgi:hypothetical protein
MLTTLPRALLIGLTAPGLLAAQIPAGLAAERADYAQWLRTSPASPYAAVYHQPLNDDLVFGLQGHPVLTEAPQATLSQGRLGLSLRTEAGRRSVPRNRDVALGDWRLRVSGPRQVNVVTVFAPLGEPVDHPGWFPYAESLSVEGELQRPERATERRMLGLDGVEVTATLAGTLEAEVLGESVQLTVYRVPMPGSEEDELTIFFRDGTSGQETYPPGRFVVLQPLGEGRYGLDFNRARNPFCAYNPLFPCPLPWAGNSIEARIEAGELYEAHDD